MKKLLPIIGMILVLTSCVPATQEPAISTAVPSTQTLIPSPTFPASSTPTLTITPTPSLPETIDFEFDESIPENIVDLVKTTVNQAYWYYVDLGCSPEFHHVKVVASEKALTTGTDGIQVGWDNLKYISPNMDVRISHEMSHVMCQLGIKKDPDAGHEMMWLLEGMANYFTALERFENTGMLGGVEGNAAHYEIATAVWVNDSHFCSYRFRSVEKDIQPYDTGALSRRYPDYTRVGEAAAILLSKINSNGMAAFVSYYKYLVNDPSEIAFEKAFGLTKEGFYQQFQSECENGFPTFYKDIPTPMPPAGTVRLQGNIIAKDGNPVSVHYFLVPCKLKVNLNFVDMEKCIPGTQLNPFGTFVLDLPPGYYSLSINSTDSGEAIGWYSIDGLVDEPTCAIILKLDKPQSISITIDEGNIIPC